MNYRLLLAEEWERLRPLVEPHGALPPPEAASAAVAEDDEGNIQGVLFLQLALHMEPLVIKNGHVSFRMLQAVLEEALAQAAPITYYCFSPAEGKTRDIVRIAGLTHTGWEVWRKEIN